MTIVRIRTSPDAVHDQGAPIPGGGIGDPHRGEAVTLEQVEQVPGVAPIGLRLARKRRGSSG